MLGKRVITATEMLESMIQNPRPTRAEISDVANAVYDGSSAVMLSGESAAGKHPVEAVKTMADICEFTEQHTSYQKRFYKADFRIRNTLDAVSHAVCAMAIDVGAKGIVVCSVSGTTARMVSRFRCPVDIIGMTTDERIYRRLSLSWGVTPVLAEEFTSQDVMFFHAMSSAKQVLHLEKGDRWCLPVAPSMAKPAIPIPLRWKRCNIRSIQSPGAMPGLCCYWQCGRGLSKIHKVYNLRLTFTF